MRAEARKALVLGIEFAKHSVFVTYHNEVPDPRGHQFEFASRIFARENPLNSFYPGQNISNTRRVLLILEINVDCSTATSVMLHVAVASGGDGFPDWDSFAGADLLEVHAQAFGIHSVVRSGEKCRIGSRGHGFAEKFVHARKVLFRFGRLRSPHMHWVIRGVDVQDTNVRAVLENVDGGLHKPKIDLPAVDRRSGAELLDPFGRRILRREHNLSAARK